MLPRNASSGAVWTASSVERASSMRLQVCRAPPVLGDHGVAGRSRMHAVRGPIRRTGTARERVERLLERNERRLGVPRDARGGGAPLVELGKPAGVDGAAAQHERLEDDHAYARQGAPCLL